MKLFILFTLTVALLAPLRAQTSSGLLTGPVSYTSTLTAGNPYGDNRVWIVQHPDLSTSTCSTSGVGPGGFTIPNCYIVKYVVGTPYSELVASDGTGNCYIWNVWQLRTDGQGIPVVPPCQTTFVGGAPGEYGALYCSSSSSMDFGGFYNLNCVASWDGTAVTNIDGVNTPNPTIYTINVNIKHHTVRVWIPAVFRTPAHWENWQQIDSMTVGVTPQPTN